MQGTFPPTISCMLAIKSPWQREYALVFVSSQKLHSQVSRVVMSMQNCKSKFFSIDPCHLATDPKIIQHDVASDDSTALVCTFAYSRTLIRNRRLLNTLHAPIGPTVILDHIYADDTWRSCAMPALHALHAPRFWPPLKGAAASTPSTPPWSE